MRYNCNMNIELVFQWFFIYYTFVFIFIGFIGTFSISISDSIFELDSVLISKQDFKRCVFMYQYSVYELLSDYINKKGIVILEILTTLNVWVLNIFVFLLLVTLLILKNICILFYKLFNKENDEAS